MNKTCLNCSAQFIVTDDDLRFYDKISPVFGGKQYQIPPPTHCPDCRQQRRLAFRNERKLYKRKCDFTGTEIISIYSSEKPFVVYENDTWWSDQWDPMEYGRDFDFSRSFFEQFQELQKAVPRQALFRKNAENSAYTNHCEELKNCYLCVDVGFSEDIYYSKWIIGGSKNLVDCYHLQKAERCYETQHAESMHNVVYTFLANECLDSGFLYDCGGCNNCFLCTNLRHKQYCILNKQYSKEEYIKMRQKYDLGSFHDFEVCKQQFFRLLKDIALRRSSILLNCENCSGDFVYKCKNVHASYEVIESEDCKYCYDAGFLKDCYDTYEAAFNCELQYDSHACNRGTHTLFGHVSYDVDTVIYVDSCHNSSELFGCVGLRHKNHCILNKQYSKEEYEKSVPRIIEHMRQVGDPSTSSGSQQSCEWGEFFPIEISPFAYNETVAQEYYPFRNEKIVQKGWKWKEEDQFDISGAVKKIPANTLPNHIHDIPDDILNWAVICEESKKPFKIQKGELALYREMNVPIPHLHPDVRHQKRMALRNPRKLWKRQCSKCQKDILTTYHPSRSEIVYCESCYLENVY